MSNQTPINTSDDSKQGMDENLVRILLPIAFIIISPLTAIAAVSVYVLFSYVRIKRSVIALYSLPLFIGIGIFIKPILEAFKDSWTVTFPSMTSGKITPTEGIFTMLFQQMWFAIPVGILVGLAVVSWLWYRRARWQEMQFRKTPWEKMRYNRTVKKIKADEDTPIDGMTLGVNPDGERVVQSTDEAAAHTFIVGGSNSGKSRTAMMRIRDQIKKGEGVLVVDLKADPEMVNVVKIYADRYGRKFQHFTLQDNTKTYTGPAEQGNAHYDPLTQGDHTRRADMVLDLREWGAESDYFKKMTQSYLQLMFAILINNPRKDISTLEDAIDLMSPKELALRARPLASDPRLASFVRSIDALNDEGVTGTVRENLLTNRSQLEIFLQSVAGPWLTVDKKGNNIKLLDTAYEGNVVVFSLDSLAYPSLAQNLANLIIQDLKTISSELLRTPAEKPFNVFIDEFSAIGSDNIIGLINKARASKMSVTIATQTLSDLEVKSQALSMQLIGIISSFIIHRTNHQKDAEVYAGLTGTTMVNQVSEQVEVSQGMLGGITTGIGRGGATVKKVEAFEVEPKEFKSLSQGEFIYISSHNHRIEHVRCIIEDINNPVKGGTALANTASGGPQMAATTAFTAPAEQFPNQQKVNPQFTPDPTVTLTKESEMPKKSEPKKSTQVTNASDASADDLKKVPLNYDLLRTFFNNQNDVDLQEAEDREDGLVTATAHYNAPAQSSNFPSANKLPSRPQTKKSSGFPQRPKNQPTQAPASGSKKDEFDF
jgi:intracellular multiplication protein IcmO